MADWFLFVLVLILAGGLLLVAAAYVMARMLLRPPRMGNGKAAWVLKRLSPGDLGLEFEEVSFTVRDAHTGQPLRLAGWWIPNPAAAGRCIVFIHGYADAKVGSIAWAPTFHALGWNILALDLRGHGESEGSIVTVGFYEQHDLNQVIDQLRSQRPEQTRRLALFGASMGAAVVALVGSERDDLCAIILDSPSGDEEHAASIQYELMGMPGRVAQRLAYWFVQRLTGLSIQTIRPIDLIAKIRCPLMIIHPELDVYVPPADAQAIQTAAAGRKLPTVYWKVEKTLHLMALPADPEDYRRRVGAFLADACD